MTSAGPAAAPARRVAPAARLGGVLRMPGDKSVAHRALLANALAAGGGATVTVRSPGADVRSTAAALATLGVRVVSDGDPGGGGVVAFRVEGLGTPGTIAALGAGATVDCGNSGTAMRLLAGILAAGDARGARLVGDASLSGRPMERVAAPLRAMGAEIVATDGRPPLHVRGRRPLAALEHRLPVASAQVLGAIAFAALSADGRTTVETPAETRDHTERLLAWMGAPIARDGRTTTIDGGSGLRPRDVDVPGDISAAAAWLVAAAIHPDADLRIADVGLNPSRTALIDVLREMGADIEILVTPLDGPEPVGDIVVRGGRPLRAIALGAARVAPLIDELPVLAVAMAAADGWSEVRGAGELRVKESDRIAATVRGLGAVGARVEELPDGWRVARGAPRAAEILTDGDHRIAMAFAVAAASGVASEVALDDPGCVAVSYPSFWRDLATATGAA